MMPCPLPIFSQSDYLIQVVDINSHTEWQTVQIQISWLLQKPTDLDLHCLQRQSISGLSRTRVNMVLSVRHFWKSIKSLMRSNWLKHGSLACKTWLILSIFCVGVFIAHSDIPFRVHCSVFRTGMVKGLWCPIKFSIARCDCVWVITV